MIKLTTRKVVWVDVHLDASYSQQKKHETKMLRLWQRFLRWTLNNHVDPIVRGHQGTLGWSDGYSEENAERVISWLQGQPEITQEKAAG